MRIPTTDIDEHALPRDRTTLDPAALTELRLSIATNGLRTPIEVFATATGYGLISGYRRLAAIRALFDLTGQDKYSGIEATLRTPASTAEALAAMVEENEIRESLSPWERGQIIVAARDQHLFETLDAATTALYPHASRQKRNRLRALAGLVEDLGDLLPFPEALSQNQALRLATACRHGLSDPIRTALEETKIPGPETQWEIIRPLIVEAELEARSAPPEHRPGRPRRIIRPIKGLVVRREVFKDGYILRLTGKRASSELVDSVLDEIERWLMP